MNKCCAVVACAEDCDSCESDEALGSGTAIDSFLEPESCNDIRKSDPELCPSKTFLPKSELISGTSNVPLLLSRPSEKQIRNPLLLAAPAACRRPHDHGINCNIPTVDRLLSVGTATHLAGLSSFPRLLKRDSRPPACNLLVFTKFLVRVL